MSEEDYVKLNVNSELYGQLKALTKAERAVLDYLIKYMGMYSNALVVAGEARKLLLLDVGFETGTLSNILSKLKRKGFIGKGERANEYVVSRGLVL